MITSAQEWAIGKLLNELDLTPLMFEANLGRKISALSTDDARGMIKHLEKQIRQRRKEAARDIKNHQSK